MLPPTVSKAAHRVMRVRGMALLLKAAALRRAGELALVVGV